jgi:hypothetical protein
MVPQQIGASVEVWLKGFVMILGLNQAKEDSAIRQEKLQRYSGIKYQMLTCLYVKQGNLLISRSGTKIALEGRESTLMTLITGYDTRKSEINMRKVFATILCMYCLHHCKCTVSFMCKKILN